VRIPAILLLIIYLVGAVLSFVATFAAVDIDADSQLPLVTFVAWPVFFVWVLSATLGKWARWALR
jgi:hypothetical protein